MPKGVYVRKIIVKCSEDCICHKHDKKRKRLIGVYAVINTANEKIYIGSSKDIAKRLDWHKRGIETKTHPRKLIREDSEKYGSGVFIYVVLEESCLEEQYIVEQRWLQAIRPEYNSIYEAAFHGKGIKHSKEQNENHSLIMKDKPGGFAGKTHSETTKLRLSKIRRENPLSPEHIANLFPVSFKGRTHSEETKRKISLAKKKIA